MSVEMVEDAVVDAGIQVISTVLYFPQGNDVEVIVRYPSLSSGTGSQSEFYYKQDRTFADTDPTTVTFAVPVVADPVNTGATMSTFTIPGTDNKMAGAMWWRIDYVDPSNKRTTVGFGTLLVEAV